MIGKESAVKYLEMNTEMRRLEQDKMQLENRMANIRSVLSAHEKELMQTVGRNYPKRVFVVSQSVVLVTHEKGVEVFDSSDDR